jgi:succinate dehydrogenase / fumarate reductase flavoprotein subunit
MPIPSVSVACEEFKTAENAVRQKIDTLLKIKGNRTPADFHRELGMILWDYCGMSRNEAGLTQALEMIRKLKQEYWENVKIPGTGEEFNQTLERAGRVADFFEFGELMIIDALHRKESCGCHFNTAYQTEENEAKRDDENFAYVAAWEYAGSGAEPKLHKEPLVFENVKLSQRSYK